MHILLDYLSIIKPQNTFPATRSSNCTNGGNASFVSVYSSSESVTGATANLDELQRSERKGKHGISPKLLLHFRQTS